MLFKLLLDLLISLTLSRKSSFSLAAVLGPNRWAELAFTAEHEAEEVDTNSVGITHSLCKSSEK